MKKGGDERDRMHMGTGANLSPVTRLGRKQPVHYQALLSPWDLYCVIFHIWGLNNLACGGPWWSVYHKSLNVCLLKVFNIYVV